MIRQVFIVILIGFSSLSANAQNWKKVSILPQSKIALKGVSNVNTFYCEVCDTERIAVMNLYFTTEKDRLIFTANTYQIPIENFVCENNRMTRDLQQALKMQDYPLMTLELVSLPENPDTTKNSDAELKITLAGKSNTYHLTYQSTRLSDNFYRIDLKRAFNMYDFGIEPPTAMLGLIKVKEKISIEIELYILLAE